MKPRLLGSLLLLLAGDVWAHRLDEYLQAARVSVATNRIEVSLNLTPGVAVASQVCAVIDQDGDGKFSTDERATYARHVLKGTLTALNGKPLNLRIEESTFPQLDEMTNGVGVIRIKAVADIAPLSSGHHAFNLTNGHLPALSVYLVNALVPKDRAIRLTKQTRDELQLHYRLEFVVNRSPSPAAGLHRDGRHRK